MKILAIETSCDETAISIVEFDEQDEKVSGKVLSHIVSSQVALHAPFGGVVPNIARREHQMNLIPLLKQALDESNLLNYKSRIKNEGVNHNSLFTILNSILEREPELLVQAREFFQTMSTPSVDIVAVTNGPGLEPALWVGVNFAKALATVWRKPLIPINHMEGHLFSALLQLENSKIHNSKFIIQEIEFPAIGLLISGGHTELVLMKDYLQYELLGQTRDDAVGEAFDKVARLLDLPYPGGPEISKLASKFQELRIRNKELRIRLPRPMIDSKDLDFSFSGLKTAVRYLIEKLPQPLLAEQKIEIAHEFEEAVTEVIIAKTKKALEQTGAQTLLVGGGVIANKRIRESLKKMCEENNTTLHLPEPWLTGDNATMIALSAYFRSQSKIESTDPCTIRANGTLRLH